MCDRPLSHAFHNSFSIQTAACPDHMFCGKLSGLRVLLCQILLLVSMFQTVWKELFPKLLSDVRSALQYEQDYEQEALESKEIITEKQKEGGFVNHSGGASGADTSWDQIGRKFGFVTHKHYREPNARTVDSSILRSQSISPVNMTESEWREGVQKADQAAMDLGRPLPSTLNVS